MNIYVEEWNLLRSLDLGNLRLRRPVHVCMDLAVLNELFLCNHLLEIILCNEVVVGAIYLTFTGCSSRVGHAKAKLVRVEHVRQLLDDRSFTDARRSTHDQRSKALPHLEGVHRCSFHRHILDYLPPCRFRSHEQGHFRLFQTKYTVTCQLLCFYDAIDALAPSHFVVLFNNLL